MAETTEELSAVPQTPAPELNATVRCDAGKCGAQAWTVFRNFKGQDLVFCAHDTTKHQEALMKQGFALIRDDRGKINTKPSPSANV